jgi:anti-sigma factor RsiW
MCDDSTKLIAWHDGELPDDQAAAIEQHVRACGECRGRLDAYEKVSAMLDAYCDAALASKTHRAALQRWAPVLSAAASVALLLLIFVHTRTARSVPASSAATMTADHPAAAPVPAAIRETLREPLNKPVHNNVSKRFSAARAPKQQSQQDASWLPAEPAIQIAIPGEAIFPPGALPPGVDFLADVSIAADGSPQRLRLQPQLTGFEGEPNR